MDREDDHGEEVDEKGNQEEGRSGAQKEKNNKGGGKEEHQEDHEEEEGGAQAPAESEESRGPRACGGARDVLDASLRHG